MTQLNLSLFFCFFRFFVFYEFVMDVDDKEGDELACALFLFKRKTMTRTVQIEGNIKLQIN